MSEQVTQKTTQRATRTEHTITDDELLERLLSDHPPTIFVAGVGEKSGREIALNREIVLASLELGQRFRFGDDDDGVVYQLVGDEKTVFFSLILRGERFRYKTTWYQMVDNKFHYAELAGNSPTGRPAAEQRGPLDLQETVTRIRMRLEKQPT